MLLELAPILVKLGAPVLGSILRNEVGGAVGEAGAQVLDGLAGAFGVPATSEAVVEAVRADPEAASRVRALERERRAEWYAWLTVAASQRERLLAREDAREHWFSWAWRPAMSWVLLGLWIWNAVMNAVSGGTLAAVPWDQLLSFSGLWLAIYGGGHTLKTLLKR